MPTVSYVAKVLTAYLAIAAGLAQATPRKKPVKSGKPTKSDSNSCNVECILQIGDTVFDHTCAPAPGLKNGVADLNINGNTLLAPNGDVNRRAKGGNGAVQLNLQNSYLKASNGDVKIILDGNIGEGCKYSMTLDHENWTQYHGDIIVKVGPR